MAYAPHIRKILSTGPVTLGKTLGRLAVANNIPAALLAQCTGATRMTVYNWFKGGDVFHLYEPGVQQIVDILKNAKTPETARRQLCRKHNIAT